MEYLSTTDQLWLSLEPPPEVVYVGTYEPE